MLARAEALGDDLAAGRVGYMLSGALMQLGHLAEAEEVGIRATAATERVGDGPVRAETWTVRALITALRGEFALSVRQFDEAVVLAGECGSRWGEANALLNKATSQLRGGWVAEALASCTRSIGLIKPLGDPFGEGYGLLVQGRVMRRLGDLDGAIAAFQQSVATGRANRLLIFEVMGVVEIAGCHLAAGRHGEALAWAEQGRAAAARVNWERTEAEALAVVGRALAASGNLERSQVALQQAHGIFTSLNLPEAKELRPLLTSVK